MDGFGAYFPPHWVAALKALPPGQLDSIQELRLRREEPLVASTAAGNRYISPAGFVTVPQPGVLRCSADQLEACFLAFCEQSLYAHEEELRQGYIALPGGLRVGVAGSVGRSGYSRVTSLCLRLPRQHKGCAVGLMPLVQAADGGLQNLLLVGPPASGKTSLLRDLAGQLARRRRVTVVDERGELSGLTGLPGCDVLRGCRKATGILQAVRTLAPEIVLFDELGEEEEAEAVAACAHAGVAVVASLHGDTPRWISYRPAAQLLARRRLFSRWVFLCGRQQPGQWQLCLRPEVTANEIRWYAAGGGDGDWPGPPVCRTVISSASVAAADRPFVGGAVAAADDDSPAFGGIVAANGGGWVCGNNAVVAGDGCIVGTGAF